MAVIPIKGTAGNDNLSGTAGSDIFRLRQGGDDMASGLAGDDTFYMGGAFSALDAIDGGADGDKVLLNGDYSGGVLFGAATMTNVEALRLGGAFDYNLTTHDATVAADARLTVNAANITGGHELTFDGSAELDGHFTIFGSAGNDVLTGGAKGDRFNLANGGADTANGDGGKDTFLLGATFDTTDTISGGTGDDTLILAGDYSTTLTVSGAMATGIETLVLASADTYDLEWQSAIGSHFTIDATAVNTATFDASTLASGDIHYIGGTGNHYFTGGGGNDEFDLQTAGAFYGFGNGGDDTIHLGEPTGSPFNLFDGGSGTDTVTLDGDYSGGLSLKPSIVFGVPVGFYGVENVVVAAGHSYSLYFQDDITDGGVTLNVDASALGAADVLDADFTLATSTAYAITGGAGDDIFAMGALRATDSLNGGAGFDTVTITDMVENASDTLEFSATTLVGIDRLEAAADVTLDLRAIDATVAAGATMEVDMSALVVSSLGWNGAGETDGHFNITSGGADGFISAGSQTDTITMSAHTGVYYVLGGNAADTIVCNTGQELLLTVVANSNSNAYDIISGFNADVDKFDLFVGVGSVVTTSHAISAATFDADMGAAISDAVCYVVTASGGDLIGHTFLFVDGAGGGGGYQAGQDYIFDITGFSGTFDTGDFI